MDQIITTLFFVFIFSHGEPIDIPVGPYDTYWGCDQQRRHIEETIMNSIHEADSYEIFCDRFRKN